jgi:ApbE superfamily uncharacterized protein (UPF0280 family)
MPDLGPQVAFPGDGARLHLQHGPIDLLIDVDGPGQTRTVAYRAAIERFRTVLDELVTELELLRRPVDQSGTGRRPTGVIAGRMLAAAEPISPRSPQRALTAMAAVAGAVADEIGHAMRTSIESSPIVGLSLDRWSVNNGGDIALGVGPGHHLRVGLVPDPRRPQPQARLVLGNDDGVGGVSTSGWRGRSHSLGIADAVTVAAADAARADAAATVIANAVDLGPHPSIERRPAADVDSASDLGHRPVTVAVGPLTGAEVDRALAAGLAVADRLIERGVIVGAWCSLAGRSRSTWPTGDGVIRPVVDGPWPLAPQLQ